MFIISCAIKFPQFQTGFSTGSVAAGTLRPYCGIDPNTFRALHLLGVRVNSSSYKLSEFQFWSYLGARRGHPDDDASVGTTQIR